MKPLIVTGSDTGVGKTVICAMLTLALKGIYWKPIQSGTDGGTDTQRVQAMKNVFSAPCESKCERGFVNRVSSSALWSVVYM